MGANRSWCHAVAIMAWPGRGQRRKKERGLAGGPGKERRKREKGKERTKEKKEKGKRKGKRGGPD